MSTLRPISLEPPQQSSEKMPTDGEESDQEGDTMINAYALLRSQGLIKDDEWEPDWDPNDNAKLHAHRPCSLAEFRELELKLKNHIPRKIVNATIDKFKKFDIVESILRFGWSIEEAKEMGNVLVLGNVEQIDVLWKKTRLYIEPFSSRKKYINSKRDIIDGKVDEPPKIGMDIGDEESILFTNGMHHFANLRDSGVRYIPFITNKGSLSAFKKFGVTLRIPRKRRQFKREIA